jgi:hypothetical protein
LITTKFDNNNSYHSDGHRASDWPKDPSWTGKVKIIAKGLVAAIVLLDDKNQVFAVCHVTDDSAVERTLDSGRYFVLRITNQGGRHAFIGIAFNERNDAFDFNVCLSEFKSECEREQQANRQRELGDGGGAGVDGLAAPLKDLSIKEGEKIKIKLVRHHSLELFYASKCGDRPRGGGTPNPTPTPGRHRPPRLSHPR